MLTCTLTQLTRAFEAFTEALHMFERLEDDNGISICYENLGDTYMTVSYTHLTLPTILLV